MISALKFDHDERPTDSAADNDELLTQRSGIMAFGGTGSQFIKKILPWFVGVAILVYLVWRIEINPLVSALSHANVTLYLTVLIAFMLVNFLVDAQNLNALLKYSNNAIPFHDSMMIKGASYLLMIIDWTLGMGSIVYYLKKYKGIPIARGTGCMLFLNYTTQVSMLVMAIAGCLIVSAIGALSTLMSNIVVVSAILLALTIISTIVLKLLPEKSFIKKIKQSEMMKVFIESPFSTYLMNTIYRFGFYFTFAIFFFVAVRAFNMDIPFAELIAYVSIILLVISIPLSAFGLGTSQAAMLILFKDYGTPAQILAFSLTYSASIIILRGIIGAYYYSIITKRVSHKYKASLLRGEVS